jgi:hypothetical protein
MAHERASAAGQFPVRAPDQPSDHRRYCARLPGAETNVRSRARVDPVGHI